MSLRTNQALLATVALVAAFGFTFLFPHTFANAQNTSAPPAQATTPTAAASSGKADAPLPMPVAEIVKRFAAHESQFKVERGSYTYSQSVLVQDGSGGEFRMDSDIVFTPAGKRYEMVTYAPGDTLKEFYLSPNDMKDLENIQPFVLTTEDLPKYDLEYTGREQVDELRTYVFKVSPKHLEKGQRYFQGTIWVDDHDLAVVKSYGKSIGINDAKSGEEFPRFTTYRENIEANFWFPTYTHADDILRFKTNDARIRMTVRYKNYKRFGSTVRIVDSKPVDDKSATPPTVQPAPSK
jgi:hypothetical protein